ncbi:MAG: pyrimidine 5'-nucleotidase [Rhodobacteraceae bacterium]|nr:pyrimidine 5'-nucleotidase [Paracoccaceae bacterium]
MKPGANKPSKDQRKLEAFAHVEHWVFDLDNTLYPAHTDLFSQINVRISEFVSRHLGISEEEAHVKRSAYYHKYGTTLSGLMAEHEIDPAAYLAHAHDIDYSKVARAPDLNKVLADLPGKKYVFTNGDLPHAQRTLSALGIEGHFEEVFDIVAADLVPKPHPDAYSMFLEQTGVVPSKAAMFEDLGKNLIVPKSLEMQTVHIVPDALQHVPDDAHHGSIDYITDDLALFLSGLTKSLK